MKRLIILLIFLQSLTLFGQVETPAVSDTIVSDFPCLFCDFYNEMNISDRNYEYELINKKHRLELLAQGVSIGGIAAIVAIEVANAILAVNNDWNLWIDIPCVTVLSLATAVPFVLLSNHFHKRADAIEITPVVGLASSNTVGLNVKIRF